jgi:hypothetical protein
MTGIDDSDNLDALRLSPDGVAAAKSSAEAPKPDRRRGQARIAGSFYLCPTAWADRAAAAVSSKAQLIIAFRLYRCWRTRKPGENMITASNVIVAGPGFSREGKRRALLKLEAAGLIEVVERYAMRAPRIRIIDWTVL